MEKRGGKGIEVQKREKGRKRKEGKGCQGMRSKGRIERMYVPLTAGSL
jgi:hypothetical protein